MNTNDTELDNIKATQAENTSNGSNLPEAQAQNTIVGSETPAQSVSPNTGIPAQHSATPASANAGNAAPRREKAPPVPSTSRDAVFAVITLVFSVLFADCVIFSGFRVGTTVAHILFITLATVYFGKSGKKFTLYPILCGAFSCLISVVFTLSNDRTLCPIALAAVTALSVTYYFSMWGAPRYSTGEYTTVIDIIRYTIAVPFLNVFKTVRSVLVGGNGNSKKLFKILLGLLISLPLLCAVIPLLMESDAAFENLISDIWDNIYETLGHAIIGLIIFPFIFSFLFSVNKGLDKKEDATGKKPVFANIADSAMINTVLLVLSAIYIVYLFSQLSYFFNAFSGLLPENFTVAEYARRGFFEMCSIAGINLAVVFLSLILSKLKDGKLSLLTKILDSFICVFTVLIVATALSKMWLYIQSFGMTRLRILTSCFMLVLLAAVICTTIRIFNSRFSYMKPIVLVACAVLLTVSVADIDKTVARYNVQAYLSGELPTIDTETLAELSSSATSEIIPLLHDDDAQVRVSVNNILNDAAWRYFSDELMADYEYEDYYIPEHCGEVNGKRFTLAEYREKEALREVLDEIRHRIPQNQDSF